MNFDTAFHKLLGHEGGYSNNPSDPGGETMWGVTKRVAVAHGYTDSMKDMPVETAKEIYKKLYWNAVKAEQLPEGIRYLVFDAAVNSGVSQSVEWLQRSVGVKDDGVIGSVTLAAVNASESRLIACKMLGERLQFMTDLKNWSSFSKGWARRIAHLLKEIQ